MQIIIIILLLPISIIVCTVIIILWILFLLAQFLLRPWKINREIQKRISTKKLEELLAQEDFERANDQTYYIIEQLWYQQNPLCSLKRKVSSTQNNIYYNWSCPEGQRFYEIRPKYATKYEHERVIKEISERLPFDKLLEIDNLWKKYSSGKFGFSVQAELLGNKIYRDDFMIVGGVTNSDPSGPGQYYFPVNKTNERDLPGWELGWYWLDPKETLQGYMYWIRSNYTGKCSLPDTLTFSLDAPVGHLPALGESGTFPKSYIMIGIWRKFGVY